MPTDDTPLGVLFLVILVSCPSGTAMPEDFQQWHSEGQGFILDVLCEEGGGVERDQ